MTGDVTPQTLSWDCGRLSANAATAGGWTFEQPGSSCTSRRSTASNVGVGLVTGAPGNFRATVTGSTVRIDWNGVPEVVTSHQVEAGSGPGQSNLAVFNTGSSATTLTVSNVPAGVYYARVRAIGPDNIPGPSSNEIIVTVGSCSTAPGAPTGLSVQVTVNQVVLTWTPGGGDAASSHSVEVGSGPGLSNVVVFDTGSATPTLSATAPNGTYYVRIRGRNACGTGGVSNEVLVQVPGGSTPPPTGDVPWTPPPVPDPPGAPPPVTTLVPEIQVSVPVAEPPQVVVGPPPRPDAGVGPPVEATVVASPTATTQRVRVTAATPFDTLVFAADTRIESASERVGAMAAAESYYRIRLASPQTVAELTLTVAQSFTGQVAGSRGGGPFGSYRAVPIRSTLGSGALRATLTWNTTADIDLHVIEPSGAHVYFASRTGPTASLDVDDTDGFGPENIFVPSGRAASGVYQVYIDHFSGASPTTSTITITVNAGTPQARSQTFTRTTTSAAPTVNVATVNAITGEIIGVSSARLTADEVRPPKAP